MSRLATIGSTSTAPDVKSKAVGSAVAASFCACRTATSLAACRKALSVAFVSDDALEVRVDMLEESDVNYHPHEGMATATKVTHHLSATRKRRVCASLAEKVL